MWIDNTILFLFTLTSLLSYSCNTTNGETGEEADKLTSPAVR
jgi:hypothetical protein